MFSAVLVDVGHIVLGTAVLLLIVGGVSWTFRARSRARELAEAGRSFQLLVERSADPVIIVDRDAAVTYVNPSARRVFGYLDAPVGLSALDLLHPDDRDLTVARIADAAAGDPLEGVTLRRVRTADYRWVWCETVSTNLLAEPSVRGIVVVLRDVTTRVANEVAALEEHAFTQAILDTTTALVVATTLDGRIISLNRAAEELTGYPTEEVAGQPVSMFVPEDERDGRRGDHTFDGDGVVGSTEHHWSGRDGRRRLIAWTNAVVPDADGQPLSVVATGIDVTEVRRAERAARSAEQREHDRLAWDATHDALTELLNRAGLLDGLDNLLADPGAAPVAVLFLDLDGFKAINDEHGHAVGDQVLRVVAKRLVDEVRGGDLVGRLGGDEFVVLCPNLPAELSVGTSQRIERAVSAPIALDGRQLVCGASTGVVVNEGEAAADLLDRADAAMYEVNRTRRREAPLVSPSTVFAGAPMHPREAQRVEALRRLGLLDTDADPFIDTIVRLAAAVCGTPMAAVSLIDTDRQWFKSSVGLDVDETPRSMAFCAHTILDPTQVFTVDDAEVDDRFVAHPMVTGDPHVRFYAGAPITLGDDPPIGSLCVIDTGPRHLTDAQVIKLEHLRDSLVTYLELGRPEALDEPEQPGGAVAR